jgi:hypothetical protein
MPRKSNKTEPAGEENIHQLAAETTTEVAVLDNGPYSNIHIKTAKIKKDLFLYVEYTEKMKDGDKNAKEDREAPIHEDLKVAFRKLDEHLCRISEQFNQRGEMDGFNVNCQGFTIGGSGDNEGVTLSGYRGLDSTKYLNLNSPFTKWADDYAYMSELSQAIEECKHEVKMYLFEGKHAPDAQLTMEFPEGEEEGNDVNMDDL